MSTIPLSPLESEDDGSHVHDLLRSNPAFQAPVAMPVANREVMVPPKGPKDINRMTTVHRKPSPHDGDAIQPIRVTLG